jgi:hypothetical protein
MMSECSFYINTFDEFIKTNNNENEKALWKMKAIVELMKLTKESDQSDLCENGLRMIMFLHNNYVIYPYDMDNGCVRKETLDNCSEFISILKSEFI